MLAVQRGFARNRLKEKIKGLGETLLVLLSTPLGTKSEVPDGLVRLCLSSPHFWKGGRAEALRVGMASVLEEVSCVQANQESS